MMAGGAPNDAMAAAAQQAQVFGAAFAQPADPYAVAAAGYEASQFGMSECRGQPVQAHSSDAHNSAHGPRPNQPHAWRAAQPRQHGAAVGSGHGRRQDDAQAYGQEGPKTLADWQEDVNNPKSKAYKCATRCAVFC